MTTDEILEKACYPKSEAYKRLSELQAKELAIQDCLLVLK